MLLCGGLYFAGNTWIILLDSTFFVAKNGHFSPAGTCGIRARERVATRPSGPSRVCAPLVRSRLPTKQANAALESRRRNGSPCAAVAQERRRGLAGTTDHTREWLGNGSVAARSLSPSHRAAANAAETVLEYWLCARLALSRRDMLQGVRGARAAGQPVAAGSIRTLVLGFSCRESKALEHMFRCSDPGARTGAISSARSLRNLSDGFSETPAITVHRERAAPGRLGFALCSVVPGVSGGRAVECDRRCWCARERRY